MTTASETERARLLGEWSRDPDEGSVESTVPELFQRQVAKTPDSVAVLSEQGELSYRELDQQSNRLARRLQALGVGPDVPVALCLERTPELIVALVAILKAGGAYLPLEPAYPKARMAFMLEDAAPRVLLLEAATKDALPEFSGATLHLDADADSIASESDAPVSAALSVEHLAYILYTSGSTGTPKGVLVPHRAIDRLVQRPGYAELGPAVTILQAAPVAFDASTFEIWGALTNGGRLALHPEPVPTARGLKESIRRYGVTTMWLTAALFNTVIDEDPLALEGVKELLTGGEALSVPHIRRALERLPATQLINGYGPTETTTFATCHRIPRDLPAGISSIPIGRAIRRTRLYVLDAARELVGIGATGELYIGGRGVARGYLRRDELTSERFIPDPFRPGETLYRTGDLVRFQDDGTVEYIGRADQQVKIRGFRIELGEIECALMELPWLVRAVVTARPAGGEKRLVAYGVLAAGQSAPKVSQVRHELGQKLPEYMVPAAFVWLSEIPVTQNGKVDYRALPEPSRERPELDVEYRAPQTQLEQQLCQAWSALLEIDRVGVQDNLFELGLTSLMVVRAVARLRDQHGIDIPVVKVFQYPTVAGLCAHLEKPKTLGAAPRKARQNIGKGVAIIGMAGRFPGAKNVDELWRNLTAGLDTISKFSAAELDPDVPAELAKDPRYVRARGVIADADLFDASFFGIAPKEAALMDPQQRVLFEVAWEALESSGYVPEKVSGNVGVFAGKYNDSYYSENVVTRPDLIEELGAFQVMIANEKDYVATRIAHRLDLKGPALSIHTACSTSLVATVQALQSLELGQCDLALAGGASITVPVNSGYLYQEGSMLSADGHTRSFDEKATGTTFSDGVAMVVLKRLEDAIADRDTIYAVIRGGALNNDGGNKASFTAPSVEGQAQVIAAAHASAGVEPKDIGYVETHGTATPLGDPIEVEALNLAFGGRALPKGSCAIGSVKSNVGHLVIAAGATGLIKTALALKNELVPANVHFKSPNPKIDFDAGPFRVLSEAMPWPDGPKPRFAGVSSFGVGGTNAHVVVEGAPRLPSAPASPRKSELLLISARSEAALGASALRLADYFDASPSANLADVAFTLHVGRREFPFRSVLVAASASDTAKQLRAGIKARPRTDGTPPGVVFLFPGQGSQQLGMGAALYQESPEFRGHVDDCLQRLDAGTRDSLLELAFSLGAPAEKETELGQTSLAQPGLFIIEYALAKVYEGLGIRPDAMVGHSVGEFVCAVLAGVMSLDDALRIVAERGRRMQAQPPGSMLSVRQPATTVEPLLTGDLCIASDNSPTLCVVAGPSEQVSAFARKLEADGVACRALHTSHAFHSSMMEPVVGPFLELLRQIKLSPPRIPIVSTVTGDWLKDTQAVDPEYWARQLRLPVRFRAAVGVAAAADPKRVLLEVGPRQTLATLSRQQLSAERARGRVFSGLADDPRTGGDAFRRTLGELWCAGLALDVTAVHGPSRSRIPLPSYPFERKRFWVAKAQAQPAAAPALPAPKPAAAPVAAVPLVSPSPPPIAAAAPAPTAAPATPPPAPSIMSNSHRQQILESLCSALEETSGIEIGDGDSAVPFVELGLDSLFLTQFALTVQKRFDVKITFRELQEEYPTMDSLADKIQALHPQAASAAPAPEAAPQAAAAIAAPQAAAAAPAAAPQVMMAAPAAPLPAAAFAVRAPTVGATGLQALLEQQLQVMTQQLSLLTGSPAPVFAQPAVSAPVVAEVPAPAPAPAPAPIAAAKESAAAGPASTRTPAAAAAGAPAAAAEEGEGGMMKYDVKKAFGAIARIHTAKAHEVTPKQRARLDAFVRRYNERTKSSKKFTQDNRAIMADPRVVTGFKPDMKELVYPIVVERSAGSKLWDLDGNEYVDALNGFGLNLFGWQPEFVTRAIKEQLDKGHEIGPQSPLTAEVAKLMNEFTGADRSAFCNTGSEAVMGCMRVARTVTGRSLIAVMTGAYHGIFDEVLVRGTKKLRSIPAAPGIMPQAFGNVLVLDYGTPESLQILKDRAGELAAIMVEPIQSRRPDFRPKEFLTELRKLTEDNGIVYIFDEVVTGFRLGPGGAQEYFGIKADIASYGKVVGGGLPIGVIAGKAKFMDALDGGFWEFGDASTPPSGVTYFAGTFVRHPLALAAAKAVLTHLKEQGPELQRSLNERVQRFINDLTAFVQSVGAPIELKSVASLWRIMYSSEQQFGEMLFYMMRDRGVHIWDGFPCFFTTAHSDADFAHIAKAFKDSVLEMQDAGFLPEGKPKPATVNVADPSAPPVPGARLGRDPSGNPAWFVPNPTSPGQYVKLESN